MKNAKFRPKCFEIFVPNVFPIILKAIACSRLGRKDEGRRHFLEACRLDERMEYRGNLDPEITELLKD